MKKLMMIAAMMVAAVSANAQVYVGGSVGFSVSKPSGGESTTTWSLLPEVGYNLNENWAVGTVIGYGESGKSPNKAKRFEFSPYARYTAVKLNNINVFLDGGVSYVNSDIAGTKTNGFEVGIKPGVAVNLDEKLSFVTHIGFLGYDYSKVKGASGGTSSFGLSLDNSVSFGLYYNF